MKRIIVLVLTVLLMASVSLAGDNGDNKKVSLWERIRNKIERVTPKKKLVVTTAVGGVRGARSESGADLYWRGEEVQIETEEEMVKFESALLAAEKGETTQALELFEGFKEEYPKSDLKGDANQAIKELKSVLVADAVKAKEEEKKAVEEAIEEKKPVEKTVVQELLPLSTATP